MDPSPNDMFPGGRRRTCPCCRGDSAEVIYDLADYRIAECLSCGVWYNMDAVSENTGFSSDYYRQVQSNAFVNAGDNYKADASVPVYRRWLSRMTSGRDSGRILDIGCGLGIFLAVARDMGWMPSGVDTSAYAVEWVRSRLGLPVFHGAFPEMPGMAESFDAITFWDSIEHIDRPADYLLKAHEFLKPGGLALVATDSRNGLIGDAARLCYRLSQGKWIYPMQRYFIPYNTVYFTARQFCALARRCGFEIVTLEKMEYPLSKINASRWESIVLHMLYLAARITGRQAQFTLLMRKEA